MSDKVSDKIGAGGTAEAKKGKLGDEMGIRVKLRGYGVV